MRWSCRLWKQNEVEWPVEDEQANKSNSSSQNVAEEVPPERKSTKAGASQRGAKE